MGVSLVAITVTLTLHMSGLQVTSAQLDVNPELGVGLVLCSRLALTLPGVMIYNAGCPDWNGWFDVQSDLPLLIHHELNHWRQESALGPWFFASYAASAGRAFEPYDLLTDRYVGWSDQWVPERSLQDNYPVFRFSMRDGRFGVSLFSGYRL